MSSALAWGSRLYGLSWEVRRRWYARGFARPRAAGTRVVSVGNLSVGGAGKTTLTLHLARVALERGIDAAVVCKRYRPGPAGRGDEELLYAKALGDARVHAGSHKATLAAEAARAGRALVLLDDGFSHWQLERDLDIVLLDAGRRPGEDALLPLGTLREPWRALQRAHIVVISRLSPETDPEPLLAAARRLAPAATLATARHRVTRVRRWDGSATTASGGARVVTGTGNPQAVARTATEAGYDVRALAAYRDHHAFRPEEARRELEHARREDSSLVITAKDAVRWPEACADERLVVIEVEWEWVSGGDEVERRVLEARPAGVREGAV